MIAVDTNVIVRFLVQDDLSQYERARSLFQQHDILIVSTVLLECEWILRRTYGYRAQQIHDAFSRLCGMPRVSLSEPEAVDRALSAYAEGLDFADALHVASSRQAKRFATFDRALVKAANRAADLIEAFEPADV